MSTYHNLGLPWWFRRWSICLQCGRTWVRSLGWEDPLEKETATHSSVLAWRIPWTEEPGGLQSVGSQRVGHDWVTLLYYTILYYKMCSVQFSPSVMGDSLWPHGLQHARPPCPSPTPGVHSNARPSSRWCHPYSLAKQSLNLRLVPVSMVQFKRILHLKSEVNLNPGLCYHPQALNSYIILKASFLSTVWHSNFLESKVIKILQNF